MGAIQRRPVARHRPRGQYGNYRLIRLLGQGGFAEVHLGKHIYLETLAAVKIMRAGQAGVDVKALFDEARIAARLVHPHIVRVLEFGLEAQVPFLVMDYASNGTLRQLHPLGSQLPPRMILGYAEQTAQALQYIHDKGYIHRDIKPENLLLGSKNELLLSDFGISIATHKTAAEEQVRVGTIAYMAPELLQLQAKPCPANDQYALAIAVYEWLCGVVPFHGTVDELIYQHLYVQPPSLCMNAPIVTQAVEDVVCKALDKDPRHRFESVREFAVALRDVFEPKPIILRDGGLSKPTILAKVPPRPIAPSPALVVDEPRQEMPRGRRNYERSIWKEIAVCFTIDLLVGIALLCMLALLNVSPLPLELLVSLSMVLLPFTRAFLNKCRPLFFLTCSLTIVAVVTATISHALILFLVTYTLLLLLSMLTTFAVSLQDL